MKQKRTIMRKEGERNKKKKKKKQKRKKRKEKAQRLLKGFSTEFIAILANQN